MSSHITVSRGHIPGETIRVTITCRNSAGDVADPDTFAVVARNPATDAETTYTWGDDAEVTRVSEGVFQLLHTPTSEHPAPWQYKALVASDEGGVTVQGRHIVQVYVVNDAFTA